MITIFTPTYNRAHTLPHLYESLKNQKIKDFEWLIVDDGSTDNTRELIEGYILEEAIKIRYYFQNNKGKHFAINLALKIAAGDYFVNIDSDDFLVSDSLEQVKLLLAEVQHPMFAGFTFLHFARSVDFEASVYGNRRWTDRQSINLQDYGEMMYCLKTEVYRKFPFPEFQGEKFCPESVVLRRIENKYKILYTDKVLVRGDYHDDGLSAKYFQLMFNNPHGSLLNYKERITYTKKFTEKLSLAKNYFDIAWKSDKTTMREKYLTLNPILTLVVIWQNFLRH